jgi:hypothetical protein
MVNTAKETLVKCPFCGHKANKFKDRFDKLGFVLALIFGFMLASSDIGFLFNLAGGGLFTGAFLYLIMRRGKVECPKCNTAIN